MLPTRFYFNDFIDHFLENEGNKMKCDIYEKDNVYHVEMDLPGFEKEEIKIECNSGNLIVTAERSENNKESDEEKVYLHRERVYNKYSRSFYLDNINEDAIDAKFSNGILSISIPKINEDKSKKFIDIK